MTQVLYHSRGIRASACVIMAGAIVAAAMLSALLVAVSLSRWDIYVQTGETYLTTFADGTQGYVNQGEIRNVARFGIGTRAMLWSCAALLAIVAASLLVRLYCAMHACLTVYADRVEWHGMRWNPFLRRSVAIPLSSVVAIRAIRGPIPGVLIVCSSGESVRCDCRNPKTVLGFVAGSAGQ
ncbi:hypothetical protein [Bifidobacterium phasiani]|uniref:Uncharacterized protein n=1 Tax=Bifidobacterium phasiani TaxID=2834431 RepID=A0ABS6W738_9BIFI|nr:hypothetical protein [Bifidobacterium phasiani]MBW3082309.1 hypothetical protein [Bifidobacterium phasiani]